MHGMVDPLVTPLFGVAVAFTKILLRSTNNNLGADIIGDTAEPLAAISQLVLGKKSSKKQLERAINRDLDTRMRNMNERCHREGIDPNRLANPCAEVEAVLNTIDDHEWILEQAVHDPDALRTDFKKRALKQRAQVDERLVPYFDELIKAVVEQYIDYAERSPNYLHVAAKRSLKNDKESREADAKILDAVDDVRHMVGKFASSDSKPSRVFFGSRPDVVTEKRFVERDEQEHLNALITDPTRRRTVLVGMRGCGKTQLASTLAQQCEDAHWSLVAWVNASSTESITSDLVELARELKIDTSDQPTPEAIIRRLFTRLKSAGPSDRLIVFDNVENINDLRGLVPRGNGLRVIATTTNHTGWEHQGWDTIKVEVFDRDESIKYLLTATESTDRDAADTLAHRLGDLPLALAQAAATALNEDWTLTQYLRRLETHRSEQVIRSSSGDEYPHDVYEALRMAIRGTLNNLDEGTRRAARRQLGALALLAESGVPTHWLDPMSEEPNDAEFQDHDRAADEDAHNALTKLIRRSIVQQSADKATTTLHRLQAEVLRESWGEREKVQAYEWAAEILNYVSQIASSDNDFKMRSELIVELVQQLHAMSKQAHSHPILRYSLIHNCLLRTMTSAHDLGLSHITVNLTDAAAFSSASMFDKPDTLICLGQNLAMGYLTAGKLSDALSLFEVTLESSRINFGPDHKTTLTCRHNLAYTNFSMRRFDQAHELYQDLLDDRKRLLGFDHEDTLATRLNLAYSLQEMGKIDDAIKEYEAILTDIKNRSTDSAHTLTTQHNLARAYHQSGRITDAINLYEELIANSDQILGSAHPKTIASRANLSGVYTSESKFDAAIHLLEEVLATLKEANRDDTTQSLSISSNLGYTYRLAGDLNKAIKIFKDTLTKSMRIFGDNHTLTAMIKEHLEAARRELAQQEGDSCTEESDAQD